MEIYSANLWRPCFPEPSENIPSFDFNMAITMRGCTAFFYLFRLGFMKVLVRTVAAAIIILLLGLSIYLIFPHLKPNNDAFAPKTPSSSVSPRLKGIFKGMGDGFSR